MISGLMPRDLTQNSEIKKKLSWTWSTTGKLVDKKKQEENFSLEENRLT